MFFSFSGIRKILAKFRDTLEYAKILLHHASWLYLGKIVGSVAGLIGTLFVISRLDVAAYGTVGYIIAFTSIIANFIDFRIWETIVNFYGTHREKGEFHLGQAVIRYCYVLDIVTGIVAFIVIWMLAGIGSYTYLQNDEIVSLIRLYGVSVLVLTADGTSSAILRVHDRYQWLGLHSSVSSIIRLIFVIGFMLWEPSIHSLILAYVCRNVVQAIFIYSLTFVELRSYAAKMENQSETSDSNARLTRSDYWEMFKYSLGTNIFASLQKLAMQSDDLFVGWVAGPVVLGLYRLAYNIARVVIEVKNTAVQALYPDIVKALANGSRPQLSKTLRGSGLLLAGLSISLTLVILFVGIPLLPYVVDDPDYLQAVPYGIILLVAVALNSPFAWVTHFIMAYRQLVAVNLMKVAEFGAWISIMIVGYRLWGGIAVAIAFVLREIIRSLLGFGYIRYKGLLSSDAQTASA